MKRQKPKIVKLDAAELEEILKRAESRTFSDQDYKIVITIIKAYVQVLALLQKGKVSISRLKKMIFGSSTEKTSSVVETDRSSPSQDESTDSSDKTDSSDDSDDKPDSGGMPNSADKPSSSPSKPPAKGHGRNGADAYSGAEQTEVPHESLQAGEPCPECEDGSRLYQMTESGTFVEIVGQAPLGGTVYTLQKLRCNFCGKIFTAELPEGIGPKKYDATAAAMIGMLKYGTGLPFNRMDGLQGNLGIPMPASTQWEIVDDMYVKIDPVFHCLVWHAGQGELVHNDDTTVKILELMGKRADQTILAGMSLDEEGIGEHRTGMVTTGIVSMNEGHRIALFFSSRQHAGENLKDVLAQRAKNLEPPIQMCDGLSRNLPGELKTILANCLAHGRRKFVEVYDIFPAECKYVLEVLKIIYINDAKARKRLLSPEERLRFHQTESGPVMEELHVWFNRQFDDRLVEPNSELGQSINYMLKHWNALTLFLRRAGAPLDNNICERALKKAILHRKNALFFRSRKGARVGDTFMSLIYTCQLCMANPFDYLTELYRNAEDVAANPDRWLPWNYHETLVSVPADP
ncbi:MAG TPA: IS66 family transposase [Mizugakiibacter sp.]|nr:IS66 family transposase [Mizugakiibacter sp.]